jgi:NADH:ubiquinone oxidoreductase subunit 5 (subunit L)/multisubunit Na+/H+ antiporter MnhA subunit
VAGVAAWMLAVHHWQRPGTALRATRTLVVLRVADLALLLGLVMTFAKFSTNIIEQPATNGQLTNDPFSFAQLGKAAHLGHLGGVPGVGARTLVVLATLFVVAAVIRAAIGPLHLWLSGALEAPVAGVALIAVSAIVPAGLLVARVYPVLLEAPHLLTVLALVGAGTAAAGAVLALAQRDLLRIGMFALASQSGLILAAFGMGGYSPALFALFTASFLAVAYFLVAGNLSRGFRSTTLADCAGARRRMPRTTLAVGGWALGVSGLSLNTYSVLSATFRNHLPNGGHVSTPAQVLVAAGVLLTMGLTALYAFRVYFTVATGEPPRRRGFDVLRLREVDRRRRDTVLVALAGAAAATLVGLPGVNSFFVGARKIPGFTFSHFIFYGPIRQQLALDGIALALCVVVAAGAAFGAWRLFASDRQASSVPLRARLATVATLLSGPTPAERLAGAAPRLFLRAGETLDSIDAQVLDPITTGMGESVGALGQAMTRLRGTRFGVSLVAALATIAVLLAASVLAVTGHFPVTTR